MEKLRGKTAFITGGASGIGLGIAKAAAEAGMKVVIADLRRAAIDEALPWFNENGFEAIGIELNVTDREAFEKAAEEAIAKFGNIHLLCNNAGIGARGRLWEVQYENMDIAIDINIRGVLNGIRAIVPGMIAHGEGGHIVNTASMSALLTPLAVTGLYNMTKGAVVSMTETLASELPEGVGASVFCPGPFKTNLGKNTREIPTALKGIQAPPPLVSREASDELGFDLDEAQSRELPPEVAGQLVLRGVRRGDLYIITHSEFYEGVKARLDAILRAIPKDKQNEGFKKLFSFLLYNPVFDKQREYI